MKKIVIKALLICLVLCGSGCTKKNEEKNMKKMSAKEIYELNKGCIEVKSGAIKMENETSGIVQLTVIIPDYSLLYSEAVQKEDSEFYIQQSLENGNYKTVKKIVDAEISIEDGKKVIHKDEAVEEVLENSISEAINEIVEE